MTLRSRQVRDSDPRPHFSEVSFQDTSLAGHMQVLSAQSRSLIRWDQFEAMAGLVAAFLLAFGPLTVAALTLVISLLLAEWEVAGVAAIVVAVTCPMALWLTRMAESALNEFRTGWPAYTGKCSSADSPTAQRRPAFAMLLAAQLSPLPFIRDFRWRFGGWLISPPELDWSCLPMSWLDKDSSGTVLLTECQLLFTAN